MNNNQKNTPQIVIDELTEHSVSVHSTALTIRAIQINGVIVPNSNIKVEQTDQGLIVDITMPEGMKVRFNTPYGTPDSHMDILQNGCFNHIADAEPYYTGVSPIRVITNNDIPEGTFILTDKLDPTNDDVRRAILDQFDINLHPTNPFAKQSDYCKCEAPETLADQPHTCTKCGKIIY